MSEEARELLSDARRNAAVAADLVERDDAIDIAASRAYYAMFYAAEAALLSLGLSFSSHSAVVSAFGREFAKTERLPRELHGHLRRAFDLRQSADYGPGLSVAEAAARRAVANAEQFIAAIEEYLEGLPE